VKPITNALDMLSQLQGVSYKRTDTGHHGIGFIAQDLQEILPQVVQENNDYLSVAYGNITALLTEAVKDLSQQLQDLKKQIT
jgi:hypothetical protein